MADARRIARVGGHGCRSRRRSGLMARVRGKLDNVVAKTHIEFRNGQTQIHLEQLAATAGPAKLDVRDAMLHVAAGELNFWNVQGDFLDGTINLRGNVNFNRPVKYQVDFSVADFDVEKLANSPLIPGFIAKIAGLGNVNARLSGTIPIDGTRASEQFNADGTARITGGRFGGSGWLTAIADRIGIGCESLTTGDAAALISIANRTVTFRRAAINTAALGLQGKGTITFDGDADLDIIAAPLGDWRQHIQNTNIPIISDVAGDIAGRLQRMVSATSSLLYEFQVTGKLPSPQVRTIPTPALTNRPPTSLARCWRM